MAHAGTEDEHPFVTALPPETDYMSYLTIVEANLSKASLPLLNRVLQDERLTTNVGWDLVHLLTPLLPESGECLQTIARLGNPREVVVKITEMLEIIGYDSAAAGESQASSDDGEADDHAGAEFKVSSEKADDLQGVLRVLQFCHLLRMIGILHRRIRTKRPSRFLVTIAEAVSHAYRHFPPGDLLRELADTASQTGIDASSGSTQDANRAQAQGIWQGESATNSVLALLVDLSAVTKPPLPPRTKSASSIMSQESSLVPDPEAEAVDSGEGAIQRRILISLATHIGQTLNARMRQVLPADEASWTQRYLREKLPEKMVRHGRPPTDPGVDAMSQYAQEALRRLEATLRTKLGVKADKLLGVVKGADHDGLELESLEEFPASDEGVLCLLAEATFVGQNLEHMSAADHRHMVAKYLGRSSSIDFGPESLATIDAVLYLGWKSIETATGTSEAYGTHEEEQKAYNEYLQQLSVVSANAPFSEVRFQAHLLVTKVIQETVDAGLKYGFIQDTLDFCPYTNLKVTAVGWLKDQIVAAAETEGGGGEPNSMAKYFGQRKTLENVAISVFDAAEVEDGVGAAAAMLPFWLAALNLLYVMCCNEKVRDRLEVAAVVQKYDIMERFVKRLEGFSKHLTDEEQGDGKVQADLLSDAGLLTDAVSRAKAGLDRLKA